MSSAEDYLQNVKENPEVEEIDYTVILPGGLINKPVTGTCIKLLFIIFLARISLIPY